MTELLTSWEKQEAFRAASLGNKEPVLEALKKGLPVNSTLDNDGGYTLLHRVLYAKPFSEELLDMLLTYKADCNLAGEVSAGVTILPLDIAITENLHSRVIQHLILNGADITRPGLTGSTPLTKAVAITDPERKRQVVSAIIAAEAVKSIWKGYYLREGVYFPGILDKHNQETSGIFWKKSRQLSETIANQVFSSQLHTSDEHNVRESIYLLGNELKESQFFSAKKGQAKDMTGSSSLFAKGTRVSVDEKISKIKKDAFLREFIQRGIANAKAAIGQALTSHEEALYNNPRTRTEQIIAELPATSYTVGKICELTPNLSAPDRKGYTPLHYVALYPAVDRAYVRKLVKQGVNINAYSKPDAGHVQGKTPLFLAIEKQNLPAIECLLESGADVKTPCRGQDPRDRTMCSNYTPLELALNYAERNHAGDRNAINMVLACGAVRSIADGFNSRHTDSAGMPINFNGVAPGGANFNREKQALLTQKIFNKIGELTLTIENDQDTAVAIASIGKVLAQSGRFKPTKDAHISMDDLNSFSDLITLAVKKARVAVGKNVTPIEMGEWRVNWQAKAVPNHYEKAHGKWSTGLKRLKNLFTHDRTKDPHGKQPTGWGLG